MKPIPFTKRYYALTPEEGRALKAELRERKEADILYSEYFIVNNTVSSKAVVLLLSANQRIRLRTDYPSTM